MLIASSSLSESVKCILAFEGVRTVAQLAAMDRREILYLPGIGRRRFAEIQQFLDAYGICPSDALRGALQRGVVSDRRSCPG